MLKVYQLRRSQNSFEVTLQYKGIGVRVAFVDGNTYNDIPAKCYTNDKFKQLAIENSQMFKNKEIVLERSIPEESDKKAHTVSRTAVVKNMPRTGSGKPVPKKDKPAATKPAPAPKEEDQTQENQNTDTKDADGDGLKKMEFTLAEAIQYIATNYQQQVQTPNEARAFLKEKGIKATIKNG